MEFCKSFNAATQNIEPGIPIPVVITAYADRFVQFRHQDAAGELFSEDARRGIEKGAQAAGTGIIVGRVTMAQVREIAEKKMEDLNANDIEAACRMVIGSARSMGIEVVGERENSDGETGQADTKAYEGIDRGRAAARGRGGGEAGQVARDREVRRDRRGPDEPQH